MGVYVVLLFDLEDAVVVSADTIDAQTRDAAREQAKRLLLDTPAADGYEIWIDGARVESWFPGHGTPG